MGTAILTGLLKSHQTSNGESMSNASGSKAHARPLKHFIACVRTEKSAARLKALFDAESSMVTVLTGENLKGVQQANVIIIGCEPSGYHEILNSSGICEAVSGKTLISILGGVTVEMLTVALYSRQPSTQITRPCNIIQVMPNIAVAICKSITTITKPNPLQSSDAIEIAHSLFLRLGHVKILPENCIDTATVVTASSPAFFTVMLDAIAIEAERAGFSRTEALELSARAMSSAAELILHGDAPDGVCLKIATTGGSTARGLKVLKDGNILDLIGDAFRTTRHGQHSNC